MSKLAKITGQAWNPAISAGGAQAGGGGGVVSPNITNITYDGQGRVQSFDAAGETYTCTYGASGLSTITGAGKTRTLTYDGQGRLVSDVTT